MLALLAFVVSSSSFPSFDAAWERVLAGTPPVAGAAVVAPADVAAVAHGRFTVDAAGVKVLESAPYGDTTWITSAPIGDGLVRARLVLGDKSDVAVLVRAKAADDGELEEGYAVAVDKGALRVSRIEHKVPRLLGAETKIDGGLTRGSTLEIVVVAAGPFLAVTVYDGVTLLARAHLDVHDRRTASGVVGLRFGKNNDASVAMLSAGNSAAGAAPLDDDGGGSERLLLIQKEQTALVPAGAGVFVQSSDEGVVVVTDPLGLEKILRAGVTPVRVRTQVPWLDEDASLRAHVGKAPQPTATGFRVDESYKDAAMVAAILTAYAARFPALSRLEQIGVTTEGRALWALALGKGDDPVLLDGAHHGGELMSIEFVVDAVQQLLEGYGRDPQMTQFLDHLTVWCVPLVNVDGNTRYVHETRDYDRKNGRDIDDNGKIDGWDGVDLYRNYPADWGGLGEVGSRSNPFHYRYRGPSAASEPEIQAMMKLATREHFTSSIDFHTNATAILVPYTNPHMTSPEPNELWAIAKEMGDATPVQVNGRRYSVQRNLYPVDGVYQDWLRLTFGTAALLVEGPTNNPLPYGKNRTAAVAGTRPTWKTLLARTLKGPGIVGHVRDAAGNPLEAQVSLDEQKTFMGEVWTTRARDGRFHRLLPPGTWTLRVRAPGYAEQSTRVDVKDKNVDVEIVLTSE